MAVVRTGVGARQFMVMKQLPGWGFFVKMIDFCFEGY